MQLVIGSTYESSRGFGRLLYLGETHDIDGYLPTFRTTKGDLKFYGYDQLPIALVEFAPTAVSRADELIACLEGEIAKRDARIAELEQYEYAFNEWLNKTEWVQEESASFSAKYLGLHRADIMRDIIYQLLSELSAIKAQGVVIPERKTKADYGGYIDEFADEAAAIYNAALDEVARLNAAPAAPGAKP